MGWERVGRGISSSSLAPTLPPSLTYTPLCPSLSICLSASFLLWLSISTPPPPCLSLLFWAGLQDPPSPPPRFGTQAAPLAGSRSRESGQSGTRICRGLGGGGEQALERGQPAGCESERTAPALPAAIAWGCFCLGACSAQAPHKYIPRTCHLCQPWEQPSGSGPGPLGPACPWRSPLSPCSQPLSGLSLSVCHSLYYLSVLL